MYHMWLLGSLPYQIPFTGLPCRAFFLPSLPSGLPVAAHTPTPVPCLERAGGKQHGLEELSIRGH